MGSVLRSIARNIARRSGKKWPTSTPFTEEYPVMWTDVRDRHGEWVEVPCRWRTRTLHPTKGWRSQGLSTEDNAARFRMLLKARGLRAAA